MLPNDGTIMVRNVAKSLRMVRKVKDYRIHITVMSRVVNLTIYSPPP